MDDKQPEYICIPISLREHWIWKDPIKLKWWLDLVMSANSSDEIKKVSIGSQVVDCRKGEVINTLGGWSKEWGVTKDTVRCYFIKLKRENMVTHDLHTVYTRITICDYECYLITTHGQHTDNTRTVKSRVKKGVGDTPQHTDKIIIGNTLTPSNTRLTHGNVSDIEIDKRIEHTAYEQGVSEINNSALSNSTKDEVIPEKKKEKVFTEEQLIKHGNKLVGTVYAQFVDAYFDFHTRILGNPKPIFKPREGKSIKELVEYFKKEANDNEQDAVNAFNAMFQNWNNLPLFNRTWVDINMIRAHIVEIINLVKNGQPQKPTEGEERDLARKKLYEE